MQNGQIKAARKFLRKLNELVGTLMKQGDWETLEVITADMDRTFGDFETRVDEAGKKLPTFKKAC